MTEPCGCRNEIDTASGVLRCVEKCQHHREWSVNQPRGRAYYDLLGSTKDGVPQCQKHIDELQEVVGGVQWPYTGNPVAIEIGCGCSMYVPMLTQAGYVYLGIEADPWAAEWTRQTHAVNVVCRSFPSDAEQSAGLILCAHALEHILDAPHALTVMFDMLCMGGQLVLIVPDDTDKCNPDHWWFFTEASLRSILERTGFTKIRIEVRKIVAHENFIYCTASKG